MDGISVGFIISSFLAGFLMFLAPCTLPILPGYLAFISGVKSEDLKDPSKAKENRKKIFLNGVFFVLGFSIIFVVFGTLAGFAGQALVPFRIWLTRLGGVFIILFGLLMLGILKLPFLQGEKRIKMPGWLEVGKPSSSLIIGGTFAFGWTPCVGPILGSILLLASTSATALEGAFMLAVFSLGLAVPFLIVAGAYSSATTYIKSISKYLNAIAMIGGIFLIALGILVLTDNFGLLVQYGFAFFEWIGLPEYEGLLDYL